MVKGIIFWRGPSALTGDPVMAIATGFDTPTANRKTGLMVQAWILRSDIDPVTAIHTGADSAICGDCPHRGTVIDGRAVGRSCYVQPYQAPRAVYAAAQRGVYREGDASVLAAALGNRPIRLGAYGDPAAVPYAEWQSALAGSTRRVTGYTHAWRQCDPRFAGIIMASADSEEDAMDAQALGYRTFRVGTAAETLVNGEIHCPDDKSSVHCFSCLLCGGTQGKGKTNVYIPVHGPAHVTRAFENRRIPAGTY